jgi:hypothetical protein
MKDGEKMGVWIRNGLSLMESDSIRTIVVKKDGGFRVVIHYRNDHVRNKYDVEKIFETKKEAETCANRVMDYMAEDIGVNNIDMKRLELHLKSFP